MRQKIAAGNWKMNMNYQDGKVLIENIKKALPINDAKIILCVPFPYIMNYTDLTSDNDIISLAAQNCHHKTEGAFTGEVSITMLSSIGVEYVLIGHSERRQYNNETDAIVKSKIDICLDKGMNPIYCCGESQEIRSEGHHIQFVNQQLENSLLHLSLAQISEVIIAYEPIWAIGTGLSASPEQAQEMHHNIRRTLRSKYGDTADSIPILYGGSVKPNNAKELFEKEDVDGGLVGGASLDADGFIEIARSF